MTIRPNPWMRSAIAAKEVSGAASGTPEDEAGILLGEKPFRHNRVAVDRGYQCRHCSRQGYRWMAQHRAQAAIVKAQHRIENALAHAIQMSVLLEAVTPDQPRAHRGRYSQRDHP